MVPSPLASRVDRKVGGSTPLLSATKETLRARVQRKGALGVQIVTYVLILIVSMTSAGGAQARIKEITGFTSYKSCEAAAAHLRGFYGFADHYAQCIAKDAP